MPEQTEQETRDYEVEVETIDKIRNKILELSTEIQALSLECEQRIAQLESKYVIEEPVKKKRGRPKRVT